MNRNIIERIYQKGIISKESYLRIINWLDLPVNIFREVKILLYLSVITFSYCLGYIIYMYSTSAGKAVALGTFSLVCFSTGTFFKSKKNITADYLILLGSLSIISFFAYLQFQYHLFNGRYSLTSFITMLLLFAAAYIYRNVATLALAISNLALWLGITVSIKNVFIINFEIIISGICLSILLYLLSHLKLHKKYFSFTYQNFSVNLFFISLLSAIINLKPEWFYSLLLLLSAVLVFRHFFKIKQKYFWVLVALYTYFGLSYFIVNTIEFSGFYSIYFIILYFIFSLAAFIYFIINMNKLSNE